jgi:sterol desaturase/sphingolipid hydroxylase (fatty acid hydroxylase superfamily)
VFADRRLLPLEAAVALLALDLFTWWWHWMNHRLAPLWRFHRLHHTDPAMNSTTAFRFHLGEHVISAAARGVMLGAIGLRLEWVILWELLFLPLVVFQHSRIPLPTPWERTLRLVIITPGVHRVHHSPDRIETDSHFGSILSIWDRLFGTWRPRDDAFDRPTGLPDRGAG